MGQPTHRPVHIREPASRQWVSVATATGLVPCRCRPGRCRARSHRSGRRTLPGGWCRGEPSAGSAGPCASDLGSSRWRCGGVSWSWSRSSQGGAGAGRALPAESQPDRGDGWRLRCRRAARQRPWLPIGRSRSRWSARRRRSQLRSAPERRPRCACSSGPVPSARPDRRRSGAGPSAGEGGQSQVKPMVDPPGRPRSYGSGERPPPASSGCCRTVPTGRADVEAQAWHQTDALARTATHNAPRFVRCPMVPPAGSAY